MNSQFILNYTGQKFKETKELDEIDFSKYKTVIECFGGSFGFSRYLYEIKELKDEIPKLDQLDVDMKEQFKSIIGVKVSS